VVSGWRKHRRDTLILRKILRLANRLIRLVTGVVVHDQGCSLQGLPQRSGAGLDLYADMHRFIAILTMALGASISGGSPPSSPGGGEIKYSISRTFRVLIDLFTIQMQTWFRRIPCVGSCFWGHPSWGLPSLPRWRPF
jgi:hypothetical protein